MPDQLNPIQDLLNQIDTRMNELSETGVIPSNVLDGDIESLIPNLLNNINNPRTRFIRLPRPEGSNHNRPRGIITASITRVNNSNNESTGLTGEEIDSLYTYTQRKDSNESCSICMEKFKKGEKLIKVDCNHEFHSRCLKLWLTNHKTCPVCRFDIHIRFEESKKMIGKLANIQSIINMIPYILISNPPMEETNDDDETEENNNIGLFGWFKWGAKQLGSYLINNLQ